MSGRILFLNRWPRSNDSRRWDDELARFADLSHGWEVSYLVDPAGASAVPKGGDLHLVDDFGDVDAVLRCTDRIVRTSGSFDRVIAFSEFLLDLAASIRARYGIPGLTPEETDRFRDKRIMKAVLARAGVRVPRWVGCTTGEQVLRDAAELGYPLILKPARGASSLGVHKITGPKELELLCARTGLADHQIEEFITGDIMHADGVVDRDGRCLFVSLARYVSTCLDFEQGGEILGSVLQTDPAIRARLTPFVLDVLAALGLTGSAFHLEFFDTGTDLVFLEIGARVPGADVPYVIHDVHGVNLFRMWVDVQLNRPVEVPVPGVFGSTTSGGWLTIARPRPLPRRVVSVTPLLGQVPYLYRELVPRPGEILREHVGSYATVQSARFLFRGGDAGEIGEAMRQAHTSFRLESDPVEVDPGSHESPRNPPESPMNED